MGAAAIERDHFEQPTEVVVFTSLLPAHVRGDQCAAKQVALTWAREKKTEIMKDFGLLDTYGMAAAYTLRIVVDGPPDFEAHQALGALGFRLDNSKPERAYRLALLSHWQATTFESTVAAAVPREFSLAQCRRVARHFVRCVNEELGFALDFSPDSLAPLSHVFTQHERGGLSPMVFLPSTVIAMGCHFGEVLIRELSWAGCGWLEQEDAEGCNFALGPARINPWRRALDMCVYGSEATLAGCMDEVVRLYSKNHERPIHPEPRGPACGGVDRFVRPAYAHMHADESRYR